MPTLPDVMLLATLGGFLLAGHAGAATFTVTKVTDDNGPCTPDDCALREAVIAANALPGLDSIEVSAGVYPLSIPGSGETGGSIDITDDVEISGVPGETTIVGDDEGVLLVLGQFGVSETQATISGLHITGGRAEFGGGIRTSLANVLVIDSVIEGNTAVIEGGGIDVAIGTLVLQRSTVANNHSDGRGGGISRRSVAGGTPAFVTLRNSTLTSNSADLDGGGIYSFGGDGDLRIESSTLAANQAGRWGDLVMLDISIGPQFLNSLLEGDCFFVGSQFPMSLGGNVGKDADFCFLDAPSDQDGVADLGLLPLGDYGGPTPTHALSQASPAIDAALLADCPPEDQRGELRPIDGDLDMQADCDSGAFELQPIDTPLAVPALSLAGVAAFIGLLMAAAVLRLSGL